MSDVYYESLHIVFFFFAAYLLVLRLNLRRWIDLARHCLVVAYWMAAFSVAVQLETILVRAALVLAGRHEALFQV